MNTANGESSSSSSSFEPLNATNSRTLLNNRQTTIDMPLENECSPEMMMSTLEPRVEQQNDQNTDAENDRDENPSWRLNIEINTTDVLGQARNLSQDDFTSLTNSLRQLYSNIDVVYFVPEAHFLNLIMLFFLIFTLLLLRVVSNMSGFIVLCVIRLSHYFDAIRFKLRNETRLTSIWLRIFTRNLLVYVFFDQEVYFKILRFDVIETDSFVYVAFVLVMANMIIFDAMLMAKVLLAVIPRMQMRQKREFVKVTEHFLMLYVSALPILQWHQFIGNIWLSLPYLLLKFVIYAHLLLRALRVFRQYIQIAKIGKTPSSAELSGQICAICHCEPEKALKIACGHIFDEQCLKDWLEVKNECPLCRQIVIARHTSYPNVSIFPPFVF